MATSERSFTRRRVTPEAFRMVTRGVIDHGLWATSVGLATYGLRQAIQADAEPNMPFEGRELKSMEVPFFPMLSGGKRLIYYPPYHTNPDRLDKQIKAALATLAASLIKMTSDTIYKNLS